VRAWLEAVRSSEGCKRQDERRCVTCKRSRFAGVTHRTGFFMSERHPDTWRADAATPRCN
jgi:hypothetical protein